MADVRSDRRSAPRADDSGLRGRRIEPRASIILPASVEALGGRQPLSLIEVSRSGARLEGHDLPAVGKGVILRCGKLDTFGTVAWAVDGRCGVAFDQPIGTQELIEIRHLALVTERTQMTPEEIQAMADWKNGLAR